MKYFVATANKITGEITYKHIEANSAKDPAIEEYLDQLGETFWAVYPPAVPEEVARNNFDDYLKCRTGNN